MTGIKCGTHNNYRGIRRPKVNCLACWEIFFANNPDKVKDSDLAKVDALKSSPYAVGKRVKKVKVIPTKCKKHKAYRGLRRPKTDCLDCWLIFQNVNPMAMRGGDKARIERIKRLQEQRDMFK